MNDKEYEPIRAANGAPLGLSVFDLMDQSDRTLLYGYTCDRDTYHAYLLGGEIHRHIYKFNEETISHVNYGGTVSAAHDIIPDKRLYPAACDAETCRVLIGRGFYLPFTTFEDRGSRTFYGAVFTEPTPCPLHPPSRPRRHRIHQLCHCDHAATMERGRASGTDAGTGRADVPADGSVAAEVWGV